MLIIDNKTRTITNNRESIPITDDRLREILGEPLQRCRKTAIVEAVQVNYPFRVEGIDDITHNVEEGRPGDYLLRGVAGEYYKCTREVFERSYEFLPQQEGTETTKTAASS